MRNIIKCFFLTILMGAIWVACNNSTTAVGELNQETGWQRQGFETNEVTCLLNAGNVLIIGTQNGLFQMRGNRFISFGLENYVIKGIVRLRNGDFLAGAIKKNGYTRGDVTLFRSMAQNAYWEPFLNNFGGNQNYTEFSSGPFVANSSSDTLFINKFGAIVRTSNGGKSWELIAGEWDSGDTGLATLFYADPYFDRLWSGGITGISQTYLWKSIDYENNKWANVSEGLSDNAEATPYDIMTDPKDKDLVLIGLGGAFEASNNVKKSTNGGQDWQNVLDSTGVHTFARDKKNTDLIYASGRDTSGKLFYVTTADFGESWEKNIFVESSSPITTNDLAVMIINGKKMLFLGTDHGLFSYTFPD